jgi:hypothetical protein
MSSKEAEAKNAAAEADASRENAPPAYSEVPHGPTIESPFDFPSNDPPPPTFTEAAASSSTAVATTATTAPAATAAIAATAAPTPSLAPLFRPIAIPQISPDKSAPFLDAYARPLMLYGIMPESWSAFLDTLSAFLAAKVSEKALAHAADISRHVLDVPKQFGKQTFESAKSVGSNIRDAAKSGSVVGTTLGVVGGAISLSVGTGVRAAGAAIGVSFAAMSSLTKKPKTPRERATAYATAANKKWLSARGLRAELVDTEELARMTGVAVTKLLDLASAPVDGRAVSRLSALRDYIGDLEISEGAILELSANSLWLVITQEGSTFSSVKSKGDKKT